ncbi:hypothetical protein [Pedobacter alpinus]|uniref:MORN repeat variant n=1 Tax=Pedobacter alpinus TaxID=1590643 RepID=A0ABW5TMT8_9SPHI
MKYLIIIFLITPVLAFSQIDFAKQVKKKDMKDVSFFDEIDENGKITYGFKIGGKLVGANLVADKKTGVNIYSTYNTNNQMDGTTIIQNQQTKDVELYTYRKNIKEGPAFQMSPKAVGWSNVFENDKPTNKQYKVNHSFDYYTAKNTTSFEGFTYQKYKSSVAIGYFAYSKAAYPIVFYYDGGDAYYGQCIQGQRKEFGVYFYSDKTTYIGAWHNGYKSGLGFKVDANGKVLEKGFYDDGKLIIAL